VADRVGDDVDQDGGGGEAVDRHPPAAVAEVEQEPGDGLDQEQAVQRPVQDDVDGAPFGLARHRHGQRPDLGERDAALEAAAEHVDRVGRRGEVQREP
jgi:hypothetical protein